MASGKRPTKAELEQRIAEVAELLLTRVSKEAVVRFGSQRWGVGKRAMEKYMVKAREQIRSRASYDLTDELAKAMADYELIFAKQMAKGDLRGARQTLDKFVDLLGLAAPVRYEHGGPRGGPIEITMEMLDREIARLEAELGAAAGQR